MSKTMPLCCLIAASLFLSFSFAKGADAAVSTPANPVLSSGDQRGIGAIEGRRISDGVWR